MRSPDIAFRFSANLSEVRGPEAIIVLSSDTSDTSGICVTSSRINVIFSWLVIFSVTSRENFSRSTAKAPPAGTLASFAHESINEFANSSSSFEIPAAEILSSLFSEPSELLQTISANNPVLCAGVKRAGRIS